jgi:hypothetical protein
MLDLQTSLVIVSLVTVLAMLTVSRRASNPAKSARVVASSTYSTNQNKHSAHPARTAAPSRHDGSHTHCAANFSERDASSVRAAACTSPAAVAARPASATAAAPQAAATARLSPASTVAPALKPPAAIVPVAADCSPADRLEQPTRRSPCRNGEQCRSFHCPYAHPELRRKPCRLADSCRRANCSFLHPSSPNAEGGVAAGPSHHYHHHTVVQRSDCQHGARCKLYDCNRIHPAGRTILCRFGARCHREGCSFLHPKTKTNIL